MGRRKRTRNRTKDKHDDAKQRAARRHPLKATRRLLIAMACASSVLLIGIVAALLVTRKIGATPLKSLDMASGVKPFTATASRAKIPNPNTSQMDANVRKTLVRARADVASAVDSVEAWGIYGAACDAHKLFSCAETCYRQAMALAPQDFRFPYLLGMVLDAHGRNAEESLRLFDKAASLAPEFAMIPFRRGDVLVRQGRTDEAIKSYERAIELDDTLAMAERRLGQLLLSLGSIGPAIIHLGRAADMDPDDSVVHTALAQAHRSLGDQDRADELLVHAGDLKPAIVVPDPVRAEVRAMATGSPLIYSRAKDNYYKGNYAESISDFLVVARARPTDPLVEVYIGSAYRRMQEFDRAEEHLRKALGIDPECLPALSDLGYLLMNQRRLDEAGTILRKADRLEPGHPTVNKRLGNVFVWQGRFAEAIRCFEVSAASRPASAAMLVNWAIALRDSGRPRKAVGHLQSAIAMNSDFAVAHEQLGITWEALGESSRAEQAYRRAVEIDPTNPAASRLASH